jgi:hypothetical protein
MATSLPKVPPDIARRIAALGKAAPPPPAAPVAKPGPVMAPGGGASRLILGGALALAALGVVALGYQRLQQQHAAALAAQARAYEEQIAQLRAESAAQLQKVADDAAAAQVVLQAELDFQKLPEIPLETVFRANQVLFVSNNSKDAFTCKVRLFRPIGGVTREVDFSMRGGGYQDLAAIGDWVFARGDKVQFVKGGYKPRELVVP